VRLIGLCGGVWAAAVLVAQPAIERPRILGVAHIAIYVKDLAKARQFYEDFLGFGEPFTLPTSDGKGVAIAFVKVNDQQYFELFTGPDQGEGQLHHIALYTDSADRLFAYLKSQGIAVLGDQGRVAKGRTGNKNFNVRDPDGHIVEMVEYLPDSWTAREAGKFMPATRISDRIMHVGILAGDLERANGFYASILGFREFWRGSRSPDVLNWVNMRTPDGEDYVEFMLYDQLPGPGARGTAHHASLMVADAAKAVEELKRRAAKAGYTREIAMQTGINRKRQVNLYDPDGTRIELMEANTVDGKPAPVSSAPPPKH